jgi:AcrR family transcriptional regulator
MTDVASSSLRVADTKALTRPPARALSHNLNGQRLGRKGRDTRDRIIAAAQILIADRYAPPLTLSAVAREASLGMTSLYNYFGDLTELLLALLEPVVVEAETAYISKLRARWSD